MSEFWLDTGVMLFRWGTWLLVALAVVAFFSAPDPPMTPDHPSGLTISLVVLGVAVASKLAHLWCEKELKRVQEEKRKAKEKCKAESLERYRKMVDPNATEVPELIPTLISLAIDHYTKKKSNDPQDLRKYLPKDKQ